MQRYPARGNKYRHKHQLFNRAYIFHFRRTMQLAWPVVLSQLSHILVGLADSVMVGQTGKIPLAASALGQAVWGIMFCFALGVSYGLTPLIARADGEGNHNDIKALFKNSFILNMMLGIIMLCLAPFMPLVLGFLGQKPEVIAPAGPFLFVFMLSLFPMMFFFSFKQFAEGMSSTRPAMIISLGACAVNIGLNFLLIFGNLGFPKMGLQGAAWATFISRSLMAIAMCIYVWRNPAFKQYLFRLNFGGFSWAYCMRILKVGFPVCLQFLFEFGTFSAAAIIAGQISSTAQAAHQIALNLAAITYMAGSGISAAASVRIGNYLGRRDYRGLTMAGKSAFLLVIAFMSACAVVFIFSSGFLPAMYTTDKDVIRAASELVVIAAFFQLSDGIQVVGQGVLRGMADVKVPTLLSLLSYWLLGIPVGWFLGVYLEMGVRGIWYGLLLGLTSSAVMLLIRFFGMARRQKNNMISAAF
ncbi:MAG: MATE family efflux transporter [Bacteroidota bacterium]